MSTHYIISDTHLANGGRRDDFKKNRTQFKNFLRMVKKEKAQLVIAGDFLELWQVSLIDIARAYSDILNQLISLGTKIVIGNHDYYLRHFRGLKFLYDSLQIPGTKIFIQHGHQFDRFNDPQRLIRLGNLAAMSAAVMEDLHPDLDEKAMNLLQLLNQKLSRLPFWSPGTRKKEYLSRGGDFSEYLKGARGLLYPGGHRKKFDYVILGHTHGPGTAFQGRYLNAGSWTSSRPTYVEVNARGQCTLKYWPTQRPVKKLL